MSAKRHRHTFHALSYHFGPYGDQHVHVHPCWDEDCDRALIGQGRWCSGEPDDHKRETLDAGCDTHPITSEEWQGEARPT